MRICAAVMAVKEVDVLAFLFSVGGLGVVLRSCANLVMNLDIPLLLFVDVSLHFPWFDIGALPPRTLGLLSAQLAQFS